MAIAILCAALMGCSSNRGQTTGSGGENPDPTPTKTDTLEAKEDKAAKEKTGKDRHGKKTGTFDAVNTFTLEIPEGAGEVNAWFAMPQTNDPDQVVSNWKVECEHKTSVVKDELGNEFLHLSLSKPAAGTITIKTSFTLKRHEVNMPVDASLTRPHTTDELKSLKKYLTEQAQGQVTDDIRAMAKEAVGDEKNPLKMGRLLYDKIIDHVQYWVIDPGTLKSSGSGSATYTYEKCTGNCTDFHGLYHALCMAVGLPCRTVYGGFFKGPLDGVDRDASYHCWLEIHAPNVGWVPLDVSIADLYAQEIELTDANRELVNLTLPDGYHGKDLKLVDYYYGNLDERRVVWHEGRDLELGQKDGPINFLPWYYAEVDGKKAGIGKRKFTYNSKK
jgi:hypothetical protein